MLGSIVFSQNEGNSSKLTYFAESNLMPCRETWLEKILTSLAQDLFYLCLNGNIESIYIPLDQLQKYNQTNSIKEIVMVLL